MSEGTAAIAAHREAPSAKAARIRSLLRCPRCGSVLEDAPGRGLTCRSPLCGSAFPVIDGVPILIDERCSVFVGGDGNAAPVRRRPGSRLRDLAFRFTPDLDRNVGRAAEELVRLLASEPRKTPLLALNVGGKHPGACAKKLLAEDWIECVELDVAAGPQADLIADPVSLPFPSGAFDLVVADAILEHLPDPQRAVGEMHRVLVPGGLVLSDTPFLLPVHGGAFDFGRFGELAHRRLFRDFEALASGISSGPGCALAHSLEQFLLSFVSSRGSRLALKLLCRLTLFWLKYADSYLVGRPGAVDGALGFYFIGRKSGTTLTDQELVRAYRGAVPDLYRT